jgi:hypothetical protein
MPAQLPWFLLFLDVKLVFRLNSLEFFPYVVVVVSCKFPVSIFRVPEL